MLSALVRTLFVLTIPLSAVTVWATESRVVLVGGYIFPPYVIEEAPERYSGATLELIELLNQSQNTFHFEFIPIAAHSRQHTWRNERYDVILFESPHWQWQQEDIGFTQPFAEDRDLYIALAEPGRDQTVFNAIDEMRIIGTRGYHYGFAGYVTDEAALQERFQITFAPTLEVTLNMLERGRGDLTLINESYIRVLSAQGRIDQSHLISEKADHTYELGIGVRPGQGLAIEWFEEQVNRLFEQGDLSELAQRWGLNLLFDHE